MRFRKKWTEKRIVYAKREHIWKLLTDCTYLSEWMPAVTNVELIRDKFIAPNSLLCVDIFVCKQTKAILYEVSDYEKERAISFYYEKPGLDVKYKFHLCDEKKGLCSIILTTDCHMNFWAAFGNKNVIQDAISYGWRLLDALDQTLTKYKAELRLF